MVSVLSSPESVLLSVVSIKVSVLAKHYALRVGSRWVSITWTHILSSARLPSFPIKTSSVLIGVAISGHTASITGG